MILETTSATITNSGDYVMFTNQVYLRILPRPPVIINIHISSEYLVHKEVMYFI